MIENTTSYKIAFSMYVALGGDPNATFESVDAVYDAIDVLFGEAGQTINVKDLNLDITENGNYTYNEDEVTGYKPVEVNVNIDTESYYNSGYTDGFTQGESEGYNDGYVEGLEDGAEDQKALLETITISENGTYTKEDGYKEVTVEVDIPVFETESLTKTLTSNGTYDYAPTTDGYSDVQITVNVPTGGDTGRPKVYNGFRFTGGDMAKIDFSQYDWSGVYNNNYFFQRCSNSTGDWSNFEENYNGNVLTCSYMFAGGNTLTSIPQFDTSKATNMDYMFQNCKKLTSIPQLDTSKVTNMDYMFYYCSALTTIPQLDTSNVISMRNMFQNCSALTTIPLLDTSKVTDMFYMFQNCKKLTSIPLLDTSNVTSMSDFFSYCTSLTSIPQLDTSKVIYAGSMFDNCTSLTSIPQLDTSKVIEWNYMFKRCTSLTSIPLLDCSNAKSVDYMFQSIGDKLTDLGGFKDLGKQTNVSGLNGYHFLYAISNLTYESIMNVINNLYDRASAGMSTLTLALNTTTMGLLSDADKAIATNKGWILS